MTPSVNLHGQILPMAGDKCFDCFRPSLSFAPERVRAVESIGKVLGKLLFRQRSRIFARNGERLIVQLNRLIETVNNECQDLRFSKVWLTNKYFSALLLVLHFVQGLKTLHRENQDAQSKSDVSLT